MDIKSITNLYREFGYLGVLLILLISFISFVGGAVAYYVTKKIDLKLAGKSKTDEEIRDIKRKRYEEFVISIEKTLSRDKNTPEKEYLNELNLIYSKMAISVPDNIVKIITKEFEGYFDDKNRNRIYIAIRKDLIGKTSLRESDLKYWSSARKTGD